MCGICGIINLDNGQPPDLDILIRMMGRLVHRGPDSSGYYRDKKVALGHSRLAIIDLKTGAQPMSNEDDSIWIIFNGEIFNYLELASELSKLGHIFKTKSDTETIVHAYEQWGTSCFERFNGQWALSLWDRKNDQIILSRDRLGIRPLYYTICQNRVLFASEVKALFADKRVERDLDPAGFSEILTFWSPVAPRTAFKNIKEVEPGHFILIKNGMIKSRSYWTISFPDIQADSGFGEKENADFLRSHLIDASKLRFTRSDVPVGSYLSGGIDSSITSSIVANNTQAPLKTFSIRFSDSEFDEGHYQKEIVKRLGSDHQDASVTARDIGSVFPDVIWHAERPILRTAPAPLFILSRRVRESGYKVVVTGEGADEVLAGYDIFREAKVRQFLARNPSSKKRLKLIRKLYPWMERSPGNSPAFANLFFSKGLDLQDPGFSHRPRWDTTSSLKNILDPEFRQAAEKIDVTEELYSKLPGDYGKWDLLCRAQWLEMVTLLPGYILSAQGDRMLMANSVEGRFPFLDYRLVDFANQLPPRHKLLALNEKHLLKIAFKDMIPETVLKRPKQPYRAPDAVSFFSGGDVDWVNEVTRVSKIKNAGIFNPKAVSGLLNKCRRLKGHRMSNTDNMRTVALMSTMLVFHHFIEGDGRGGNDEIPAVPMNAIDNAC